MARFFRSVLYGAVGFVTAFSILILIGNRHSQTTVVEQKTLTTSNLAIFKPELDNKTYKMEKLDLSQVDKDRIVYLYGEINGDNGPNVAKQILKLASSPKPIYIFINSPGGSVLAGSKIVSAIQAAKGPVNTVCIELCASMAAMISQYGTQRLSLDRSIYIFHPASGGGGNGGEVDKQYSQMTFVKRFIGKMEENAANRSGLTYEAYKYRSGIELWMDAEDGLDEKFVDKIVYVTGSDIQKLEHKVEVPVDSETSEMFNETEAKLQSIDVMWE